MLLTQYKKIIETRKYHNYLGKKIGKEDIIIHNHIVCKLSARIHKNPLNLIGRYSIPSN